MQGRRRSAAAGPAGPRAAAVVASGACAGAAIAAADRGRRLLALHEPPRPAGADVAGRAVRDRSAVPGGGTAGRV